MRALDRRKFIKTGLTGASGLLFAGANARGLMPKYKENPDISILDFGARADGQTLNTAAIQKAIDRCNKKGGGRVIVPAGIFLSGSIVLKSNVQLYLDKDAVLLSSPFLKDFPQRTLRLAARYAGDLNRALIFAQGEADVSVTGPGTLDGNAKLDGSGEFKEKKSQNPLLMLFDACKNVLVKDITCKHSVWWTQAYACCHGVHVDHVTVTENYFYNADGCDIVDCDDFIVENCDINANDDGICLKGYTVDGCRHGLIRNNKVRSLCNGIKMGTDSSGGFRDIDIENNEVWETGISGLALQIVDGGIMENIRVRNISMNGVGTPVTIRLGDRDRAVVGGLAVLPGTLKNVRIADIKATVNKARKFNDEEKKRHNYGIYTSSICGIPGNQIQDISLENIFITIPEGFPPATPEDALREIPEVSTKYPENRMFGLLPAYGFYIRHARGVNMSNVRVEVKQKDGRPAFVLDDVHDSVFSGINTQNPLSAPAFSAGENCTGIHFG